MASRRFRDEPDVVLVAAAQRGEREALDALLRRHYPAVVQRCRRVLNNDADANDAAQNALVGIAKGISRFDGTSSFTTWLYRVATNAALDEVRRRNRRPEPRMFGNDALGHDDAGSSRTFVAPTAIDPKAAERFESIVDRDAINEALEKIPKEFRAPLVLRDLCGLDYAEIAEVLSIPPGTVRSRIARGRANLAPHLQRSLGEPNDPSSYGDRSLVDGQLPTGNLSGTPLEGAPEDSVTADSRGLGNFSSDVERQRFHDGH